MHRYDHLPILPIWAWLWTRTHIWNYPSDFLCSKFYGIVSTCGCTALCHLPIWNIYIYELAHCCPLDTYGLTHRPDSLKPFAKFSLFKVLCLDLQLCSVCAFAELLIQPHGTISSVRSSMELSKLAVMQNYIHLPIWPIWAFPWAKMHITLTARCIFAVRSCIVGLLMTWHPWLGISSILSSYMMMKWGWW